MKQKSTTHKQIRESRRDFLKKTTLMTGALTTGIPMLSAQCNSIKIPDNNHNDKSSIPTPSPAQIVWQEAEVGLIYHFDISVALGRHTRGNNSYREVFDPKKYNPEKLDTDQWIEAAKAAGASYAIFTATHFNGFLQWQSNAYPYGLKQASWKNGKGDIVGDFILSCQKAGIKPGIYLSTHRNAYWTLWDYYVNWGEGRGTAKQKEFNHAAEMMVEELCANYGPLIQIWFDAGTKLPHEGGPDVLPLFNKYQPRSAFYHSSKRSDHRWIGNESGYANYPCWTTMPGNEGEISHNSADWKPILGTGDPNGKIWSPGMVDVPLRGTNGVHNWFWAPDQERGVYSGEQLVKMYYDSVGRNANFVIGEVITPEGLVPDIDIQHLKKFGDEIKKRFSDPVAHGNGSGTEVTLPFPKSSKINHVIIQEEIKYGERIREYSLEGLVNGNWKKIGDGKSVGHKRIQKLDETTCSALRLLAKKSTAKPIIKNISVFQV